MSAVACSQDLLLSAETSFVEHEIDFPLEIRANKELSIYGIAGTFLFEPGHLVFKGVRSNYLDEFGLQHFNTSGLQNGMISFIYINPNGQSASIPQDSSIMSLIFTAFSDSCLASSGVFLSSNDVPWEIVKLEGQQVETLIPGLSSAKVYSACPLTIRSMEVVSPTCRGNSDGFARIETQGGFPPYRYVWNTGVLHPEINQIQGGEYIVTINDSRGHRLEKKISVQAPTPVEFDVQIQNAYCEEYPGSIQINSQYQNSLSLTWEDDESLNDVWSRSALGPGSYGFTLKNNTGCRLDTHATVQMLNIKIPQIGDTVRICEGDALKVSPSLPELTVKWYQSGYLIEPDSRIFTPESNGQFKVIYEVEGKCEVSKSFQVFIDSVDIIVLHDTLVRAGSVLRYQLDLIIDVAWSSEQFDLSCSSCEEVEFVADRTGFLSFSGFNRNDCLVKQTILIEATTPDISLPNIVTPNGDGFNDRIMLNVFHEEIAGILLFNTYGAEIGRFQSLDEFNDFINPQTISQGAYYYVLSIRSPKGTKRDYYSDLNIIYP